jgi:hypothetical protein
MAANAFGEDRWASLAVGMNDCTGKPVQIALMMLGCCTTHIHGIR